MKRFHAIVIAIPLLLVAACLDASQSWPEFRGPNGDGHTPSLNIPRTWSETENVSWSVPIPGTGWSSPVAWDKDLWMATALDDGRSLRAVCVDQVTGQIRHNIELIKVSAPEPIHRLNSHASPTPVIEDGRVYFFFGMYGAAAIDTQTGSVLWKNTELPHDHGKNGPGSSPILHEDLLILNCDGTELRYVTALDKHTGKRKWTTHRSNVEFLDGKAPDLKKAYHTPSVITMNGREELITMGAFRISGMDPATGRELWWVDIPGFSNVTRPVYGHGLIYVATGFMRPEFWAIRPGGSGDVTETHVAWKSTRQAPQKPSPVLIGDEIYMISDNGIVSCMDARTGELHYSERLGGEHSASPLVADGHIYWFDQEGTTYIQKAGKAFNVVGKNRLPDGFMASPAVVGDTLFLRTESRLYRIEQAARR
jgi:outer membrane protein assembly factor BamB